MNTSNSLIVKFTKKAITLGFVLATFNCMYNLASAAGTDNLVAIVQRVEGNISAISRLMILISYLAGVGFTMAGILQFKAHKDNPTQVPLSKPIVLVCVGAFLLFLPSLMNTAGKSIFLADQVKTPSNSVDISSISSDAANK